MLKYFYYRTIFNKKSHHVLYSHGYQREYISYLYDSDIFNKKAVSVAETSKQKFSVLSWTRSKRLYK